MLLFHTNAYLTNRFTGDFESVEFLHYETVFGPYIFNHTSAFQCLNHSFNLLFMVEKCPKKAWESCNFKQYHCSFVYKQLAIQGVSRALFILVWVYRSDRSFIQKYTSSLQLLCAMKWFLFNLSN